MSFPVHPQVTTLRTAMSAARNAVNNMVDLANAKRRPSTVEVEYARAVSAELLAAIEPAKAVDAVSVANLAGEARLLVSAIDAGIERANTEADRFAAAVASHTGSPDAGAQALDGASMTMTQIAAHYSTPHFARLTREHAAAHRYG